MAGSLLVIRANDLVVLGVESTECAFEPGVLRAVGAGATLTVRFPPQSTMETKAEGASIQGGQLSARSTITYALDVGAEVPLDVAGLLRTLVGLPVVPGHARLELPFGLVLDVEGTVAPTAAVEPVPEDGTHGLWQLVLADVPAGRPAAVVRPVNVFDREAGSDVRPLNHNQRTTLFNLGQQATARRLRLSALGGTLESHFAFGGTRWDHDLALGRDQHVRFEQTGLLYPFGFPCTVVETADRRVSGGDAALHRTTLLRIHQPLLRFPDNGTREAREFPFTEVEVTATDYPDAVTVPLGQPHVFRRPTEVIDAMDARADQIDSVELPDANASFNQIFGNIPTSMFGLEGSNFDTEDARLLRQAGADLNVAAAELQAILDELAAPPLLPDRTLTVTRQPGRATVQLSGLAPAGPRVNEVVAILERRVTGTPADGAVVTVGDEAVWEFVASAPGVIDSVLGLDLPDGADLRLRVREVETLGIDPQPAPGSLDEIDERVVFTDTVEL